MTLDERIEAAAKAMGGEIFDAPLPGHGPGECEDCDEARAEYRVQVQLILRAFAPELFTSPPGGWIAPWEPSETMVKAWSSGVLDDSKDCAADWAAMRDAHLKANAPQGGTE